MGVDALQHVNIRTADVERSREFYVRIVGLRVGDRPPIASVGYWLYLGDQPVIHLVQAPAAGSPHTGTGAIDHIAFHATDLTATRDRLVSEGLTFREAVVPRDNTVQLFVHDPDGIRIELNFDSPQA
jgi:catechol 2,3-dioxygenase-like lactoylglutathione lyase family enzyme